MLDRLRTIVATASDSTWQDLSSMLESCSVDVSRVDSVAQCKRIFCRDRVDLVFCDESLDDGNYWDVYRAVTIGLIVKPRVILMARNLGLAECEQAKQCGIFAVIESPCRKSVIEWTVLLVKRSSRGSQNSTVPDSAPKFDIFAGVPDRDAVWVCTVRGLANARERMERIAAERPGRYFIFYAPDRTILAQTETFANPSSSQKAQTDSN